MDLREWLFRTRITVSAFARLLDIDRSYVHNILKGTHKPSQEILNRIAEITLNEIKTFEDLIDKRNHHEKR